MSQSASVIVAIENRLGMHARPAMMFVEVAAKHPCAISIRRQDQSEIFDGKSIMQVMMLAATRGTKIEITATGDDAEKAVNALVKLIRSKFDEE